MFPKGLPALTGQDWLPIFLAEFINIAGDFANGRGMHSREPRYGTNAISIVEEITHISELVFAQKVGHVHSTGRSGPPSLLMSSVFTM